MMPWNINLWMEARGNWCASSNFGEDQWATSPQEALELCLNQPLSKCDEAFFKAFSQEMDQYQVTKEEFTAFRRGGRLSSIAAYTSITDAYNIWHRALRYADNTRSSE